eukprot:scaffold12976_cov197-Amphora_coffeaeformis.AAC.3
MDSFDDANENEDDNSGDVSKTEALEMLLGLGLDAFSPSAWDNESCHEEEEGETNVEKLLAAGKCATTGIKPKPRSWQHVPASAISPDEIFRRAYTCLGYCTRDGRMERPPVRIVYTGDAQGNIAVAMRPIRKGETIFTERAAAAALLHDNKLRQHNENDDVVKACPHCFRSLEPATSCVSSPNQHPFIPLPHLWPVAEYDKESLQAVDIENCQDSVLSRDAQRRLYCQDCHVWFCNEYCFQAHMQDMGISHCVVQAIWKALPDIDPDVQSAVILATRMFVQLAHYYKTTGQINGTFLDGLCGEASDVGRLELGVEVQSTDEPSSPRFSLEPFYTLAAEQLQLTPEERKVLDLPIFERLAAIAARNSVGFRTQSPFKSYYAALLRHSGGWGSYKHQQYMQQLAQALGNEDMKLDRNMDYEVEKRVAPAIAGLFTLTARLNHSCQPNATVQAQVFMDCHIDVVALEDIARDEEITISYLGPVRNIPTARRRRELRAKYLFDCTCPLCSAPTDAGLVVHDDQE